MTTLGKIVAYTVVVGLFLIAWLGHRRQQQLARETQVSFQSSAQLSSSGDLKFGESSSTQSNPFGLTARSDLDSVLELARSLFHEMNANIRDYQATLISRERVGGVLKEEAKMLVKIRQPTPDSGLSVYLKFAAPASATGREVIWVEDENEGTHDRSRGWASADAWDSRIGSQRSSRHAWPKVPDL